MAAALSDLVKSLRDHGDGLPHIQRMSLRSDLERVRELADDLEAESAPGYAVFASRIDGVFVVEALTHPVAPVSTVGPRPYLRPLRAAPRSLRAGILIADRTTARAMVSTGGLVDDLGPELRADIGKPNYGGFGGYDEHTVRARAEEETSRIWREAGSRLLEAHQERHFDYLAIGGHEEALEEISRHLHPYLARLHRAAFTASPGALTPAFIRARIAELDVEVRFESQQAIAGRVCDTAWSGGTAVLGLAGAIQAANAQAVETLVIAGEFTRPGVVCGNCGFMARAGETCPVCSSVMFEVEDVVAAVMDAVVDAGGAVIQTEIATPLDSEGIGALTRFPVS